MFNVMLVSSSLAVVIQSGKDQATVIILDARQHQSVYTQYHSVIVYLSVCLSLSLPLPSLLLPS